MAPHRCALPWPAPRPRSHRSRQRRSRLENCGFGPDDHTARTPPGRSALRIAFSPFLIVERIIRFADQTFRAVNRHRENRIERRAMRCNDIDDVCLPNCWHEDRQGYRQRCLPSDLSPRDHGRHEFATMIRASLPSTASAARRVNPMPSPPISKMRIVDRFDSSAGECGERFLRPTEAAAHQFVLAQHHGELGTSLHQTKRTSAPGTRAVSTCNHGIMQCFYAVLTESSEV